MRANESFKGIKLRHKDNETEEIRLVFYRVMQSVLQLNGEQRLCNEKIAHQ